MPRVTSRKVRSQRRIPGQHRRPMGTAVIEQIERAIAKEMARYRVSRSFVIANALAFTFCIDDQESYKDDERKGSR